VSAELYFSHTPGGEERGKRGQHRQARTLPISHHPAGKRGGKRGGRNIPISKASFLPLSFFRTEGGRETSIALVVSLIIIPSFFINRGRGRGGKKRDKKKGGGRPPRARAKNVRHRIRPPIRTKGRGGEKEEKKGQSGAALNIIGSFLKEERREKGKPGPAPHGELSHAPAPRLSSQRGLMTGKRRKWGERKIDPPLLRVQPPIFSLFSAGRGGRGGKGNREEGGPRTSVFSCFLVPAQRGGGEEREEIHIQN